MLNDIERQPIEHISLEKKIMKGKFRDQYYSINGNEFFYTLRTVTPISSRD